MIQFVTINTPRIEARGTCATAKPASSLWLSSWRWLRNWVWLTEIHSNSLLHPLDRFKDSLPSTLFGYLGPNLKPLVDTSLILQTAKMVWDSEIPNTGMIYNETWLTA